MYDRSLNYDKRKANLKLIIMKSYKFSKRNIYQLNSWEYFCNTFLIIARNKLQRIPIILAGVKSLFIKHKLLNLKKKKHQQ